ncbi:MAG TPA: efflux transporter periplasmic adaptor subunit [Gammaproteobacteria bacterium]|nr:efflux transporter periplasmic adaptor subunit [Gammaproteobacteria bacterium]
MDLIKLLLILFVTLAVGLPSPALAGDLETVQIKRSPVPRVYRLDGLVEAVNRSTLSAQTSGQVKKIYFDVEDAVEQGQVILELDDTEQQASLKQAEANLSAAKAGLHDATEDHQRIKSVFEKKLVSQSEMDEVDAVLKKARANHVSARAAREQAQKQLDYTRVKAPYPGILTERHIEIGEMAQPGKLLVSGISLKQLRVVVDVPQSLINAVRRENQAMILRPDRDWVVAEGLTIFPYAEKSSNSFKVRLDLPAGVEGLLPGMFVKAAFVAGTDQLLLVPRSAVVYRSEVIGVYTVDAAGKMMFRHIRLGHSANGGNLIVLSGLSEGDLVALDPVVAGALLKQQRGKQD